MGTEKEIEKVRRVIQPVLDSLGCELVHVQPLTEQGRHLLRILIDKVGGVSVGDCQQVSREIETLLDVEANVRSRYDLEVSSPGLNRPLVKGADFARHAGKQAYVETNTPIDGRRRYKGLLNGLEDDQIVMTVDGREYRIPMNLVGRANLVY